MNVTLKTNDQSSRRTRNRIREHGPLFRAERSKGLVWHDGMRLCWLVRAEDGWFGWLPCDEFDWNHAPREDDFRDMMPDSRELCDPHR